MINGDSTLIRKLAGPGPQVSPVMFVLHLVDACQLIADLHNCAGVSVSYSRTLTPTERCAGVPGFAVLQHSTTKA